MLHSESTFLLTKLYDTFEENLFLSASYHHFMKKKATVKLVNHLVYICLNLLIVCNEGWCAGSVNKEVAGGWGNCMKYLKRRQNRKERASLVKGWVP